MSNPNWVKGVSGNPKGRPRKGETFTDIINKVLKEKTVKWKTRNGKEKCISGKEATVRKLAELAIHGDLGAIKYLGDRMDGRPAMVDPTQKDTGAEIEADRSMIEQLLGAGEE